MPRDEADDAVDQNGEPLHVGDRVEARYKGKGTRWYAGRISAIRVNELGLTEFGIAYDDGDAEANALGVNIRKQAAAAPSATALLASERPSEDPVAPTPGGRPVAGGGAGPAPEHPQVAAPPAEAPVLTMHDQTGKLLAVGDAVEARYKGKGTRYYKGKIVDIHAEGSSGAVVASIDYDDGDKETSAKGESIRLLRSAAAAAATTPAAGAADAATGSGSRRASITTSSSEPVAVAAPAAASEPTTAASLQPAAAPAARGSGAEPETAPAAQLTGTDLTGAVLGVGDAIEARYKGKGTRFYKGKIVAAKAGANGSVVFAIDYDDGDKEAEARGEHMRLLKKAEPAPVVDAAPAVKEEAAVVVPAPAADPPATAATAVPPAESSPVAAATGASDTGASAVAATPASVPSAAPAGPVGLDEAGKELGVGDVVEAKFKGRSKRYYKGVIAGVVLAAEGGCRFRIDYDDGDKETDARGENIRLLLKKADRAPGLVPASPDAGATDPVAPAGPAAAAGTSPTAAAGATTPASGAAASTSATSSDGTSSSAASNESLAAASSAAVTVVAPTASSSSDAAVQPATTAVPVTLIGKDQSGAEIGVGDAISARYKGKGTRYYDGVIVGARTGADGAVVFAIRYDDGDAEDGAVGANIRLKHKRAAAPSVVAAAPAVAVDSTPAAAATTGAKPATEASTGKDDLIEEDVDSDADSGPDTKPKPAAITNNNGAGGADKPPAGSSSTAQAAAPAADATAGAAGSGRPTSASKRPQSATRTAGINNAGGGTVDSSAVDGAAPAASTSMAPAAAAPTASLAVEASRDEKTPIVQQAKPTISAAAAGSTSGSSADADKHGSSSSASRAGGRGDGAQGTRASSSPRGYRRGRSSSYDRRDGRRYYDDDRDDDGSRSGDGDEDDYDGYERRGGDRHRRPRHAPRRRSMDHPEDRYSDDEEADRGDGDRAGSRSRAGGRSRYRSRRDGGDDDEDGDAAGGSAHRHRSASSGVAGRPPIGDPHASFAGGGAYYGGPPASGPPPMAAGGSGDMFTVSAGTPMTVRPPVLNTGAPGFAAGGYGTHQTLPPHASPMGSVHGLGGGLLPSPAAMSYPYAHLGAPTGVAGGHFGVGVAPPAPPVAAFGRLCRELAAVRARLTPMLFDCYTAQAQARAAAADPYFAGGRIVPAPADVEHWLAAAIRRAAVVLRDPVNACNDEVASTAAVRDGFAACGCPLSRDALAVLRSAFRMRPEYAGDTPFAMLPSVVHGRVKAAATALHRAGGLLAPAAAASPAGGRVAAVDASGEKEHAAVLVTPLAAFLTCDEATSSALLMRMDAFAQKRSGRARPPMPPTVPGAGASMMTMMGAPGGGYDGGYGGGDAAGALPPAFHTPHVALPSPMAMASPGGMAAGAGMMSMLSVGASPPAAVPAATPMTASVGDFMRSHATPQEKEHLLALLATLQDFQRRTGVPQVALAGGARGPGGALADGSDSLVISLGPRLQVGVRFYVS